MTGYVAAVVVSVLSLVGSAALALSPRAATPASLAVTLDAVDADLTQLLRVVAEVGGMNLVVGDDVVGRVTVHLRRVVWRDALVAIARTKDLGVVEDGNVLFVAPQAKLDAQALRALDRGLEAEQRAPRTTRLVPVSFARARELAPLVRSLLSPRGTVSVDERTNTLIIRDIADRAAVADDAVHSGRR
jgi:type IV pilus assembly protein PilQ